MCSQHLLLSAFAVCFLVPSSVLAQVAEEAPPNYANQKIKASKDLPLYKDFHAEQMKFWKSRIEQYDKLTKDPPEIREQAKAYLGQGLSYIFSARRYHGGKELVARGEKLIQSGSTDPVVRMVHARVRHLVPSDLSQTHKILKQNEAQLTSAKYGEGFLLLNRYWYVASRAWRGGISSIQSDQNPKDPELVKRVASWLQTDVAKKANPRVVWELVESIISILHPEDRAAFYDQYGEIQDLDPWIEAMITGALHVKFAWHYRGGGYAGSVSKDGRKRFHHHIDAARASFNQAIAANPKHPNPYTEMIAASKARRDDAEKEMRSWFDKAIEREFDCLPAYNNYAFGMFPRWHGSHAQLLEFAEQCFLTKRFETGVPNFGYDLVRTVDEQVSGENVRGRPEVFVLCKRILTGMINEPSRENPKDYFVRDRAHSIRHLVKASVLASNFEESRKALDMAEGEPAFYADPEFNILYARIYATTSPGKEKAMQLHEFVTDDRAEYSPENIERLRQIMRSVPKENRHPRAKLYYDFLELHLNDQEKFASGKWVDLDFDEQGLRWMTWHGLWERLPDNTYRGTWRPSDRNHQLRCHTRFVPPYEIEVTITAKTSRAANSIAGFLIGSRGNAPKEECIFIMYDHPTKKVGAMISSGGHNISRRMRPHPTENRLTARVYSNRLEVYLNGEFATRMDPKHFNTRPRIALGCPAWRIYYGTTTFQNVRIRKLPWDAPKNLETFEEYIEYQTDRMRHEPEDKVLYYWRAIHLIHAGRPREALEDLQKAKDLRPFPAPIAHYKGLAHYRLGDYEKAKLLLENGYKGTRNNARLLMQYGWVLATCPDEKFRDPEKAFRHAVKAVTLNKYRTHYYVSTLAAAFAAKGEFKHAIKRQKKAIELYRQSKDDEPEHYMKVLALYESGKPYYVRYDKDGKEIEEDEKKESDAKKEITGNMPA